MDNTSRFLSKVDRNGPNGCWVWTGTFFSKKNRGQFWYKGNNWLAHRAAWALLRGSIPDGKMVCHTCDNESCVNPDHLYIGDQATNMADRHARGRTNRWDKRYNFVQTPERERQLAELRGNGLCIDEICDRLGIRRTTYYRMRARGIITDDRAVARANYRAAALRRERSK